MILGALACKHLFQTGEQLARNHKLLGAGENLDARRKAFAASLTDVMRRIDVIETLAQERARERAN